MQTYTQVIHEQEQRRFEARRQHQRSVDDAYNAICAAIPKSQYRDRLGRVNSERLSRWHRILRQLALKTEHYQEEAVGGVEIALWRSLRRQLNLFVADINAVFTASTARDYIFDGSRWVARAESDLVAFETEMERRAELSPWQARRDFELQAERMEG